MSFPVEQLYRRRRGQRVLLRTRDMTTPTQSGRQAHHRRGRSKCSAPRDRLSHRRLMQCPKCLESRTSRPLDRTEWNCPLRPPRSRLLPATTSGGHSLRSPASETDCPVRPRLICLVLIRPFLNYVKSLANELDTNYTAPPFAFTWRLVFHLKDYV